MKKDAPVVSESAPVVSEGNENKKPIKKKMKPRGGNNWLDPKNYLKTEPGDNTKYMSLNIELMNMPNIDMTNESEVQKRLSDYFALFGKYDVKPTVVGMAIALNGHSRRWLYAVTHDAAIGGRGNECTLPKNVTLVIKKAYNLLENLYENYMQNGKINPVSGIFLGKNNYGYQDKTEYVVTPNTNQDSEYSAEEIKERYIPSATPKQLSNSSDSE